MSQWIILDEWNREILEISYYIADTDGCGSFSRKFTDQLLGELRILLNTGKIETVGRE